MSNVSRITVANGDGIGPEIMSACLDVIRETGARLETEVNEIGENVYLSGNGAGNEMNLGIARENEKDCYAGMEYQLYDPVMERLKMITRPGSERIVQAAKACKTPARVAVEGIDVYLAWPSLDTERLAAAVQKAAGDGLELLMIENSGVKVWPDGMAGTLCTDAYRCRFSAKGGTTAKQTVALLGRVLDQGVDVVKTQTLRSFDGKPGSMIAQGQ